MNEPTIGIVSQQIRDMAEANKTSFADIKNEFKEIHTKMDKNSTRLTILETENKAKQGNWKVALGALGIIFSNIVSGVAMWLVGKR